MSASRRPHFRRNLHELTGGWTLPQIVIDDLPVGGYAELSRRDKLGVPDELAT